MKIFLSLVALALFCLGCQRPLVQARSEPLAVSYLASEKTCTPDPLRNGFVGQQIVVQWNLPRDLRSCIEEYVLVLTTRDAFGCEEVQRFELPKYRGFWVIQYVNDAYFDRGGIPTYKVDLVRNNEVAASWRHHIWVERIVLSQERP